MDLLDRRVSFLRPASSTHPARAGLCCYEGLAHAPRGCFLLGMGETEAGDSKSLS